MILLIAIPVWILAVSLIVGLCATARYGDLKHAAALAGCFQEGVEQRPDELLHPALAPRHISAHRTRAVEGSVRAHRSSAVV